MKTIRTPGLQDSVYPVAGPRALVPDAPAPLQLLGHKLLLITRTPTGLPGSWSSPTVSPSSPVAASHTSYPAHQLPWLEVCQQVTLTHAVRQFPRDTYTRVTLVAGIPPAGPCDLQPLLQLLANTNTHRTTCEITSKTGVGFNSPMWGWGTGLGQQAYRPATFLLSASLFIPFLLYFLVLVPPQSTLTSTLPSLWFLP